MVSFSSVTLLVFAYVSCLVNASPLAARDKLDVASPPVTYPTQGVVWKAGEKQIVTWDTSILPAQITNPTGKVVLGWLNDDGLNLQTDSPLADGFPITAGKVDITVPSKYPDGDNYIIVLMGSSGNTSPTFTITSGGSSSSSTVDLPSSPIPEPLAQSTSVPGSLPSTTLTSSSSVVYDNGPLSPSPSSSLHSSSLHPSSISSLSPVLSSSPSPSGTSQSSNGNTSSSNSAWVNTPANTMVVSLLVAPLVMLFL